MTSPHDPNEQAIARSAAVERLAHGAKLTGYHVESSSTCDIAISVAFSHRVDIDDDIPVTDAPLRAECLAPHQRLVYHLVATGVPSVVVTLDRRSHRILYIRPTWDTAGAERTGPGAPAALVILATHELAQLVETELGQVTHRVPPHGPHARAG